VTIVRHRLRPRGHTFSRAADLQQSRIVRRLPEKEPGTAAAVETRNGSAAAGVSDTRAWWWIVQRSTTMGGLEARICPNNIRRIRRPSSHGLDPMLRSTIMSATARCFA